MGDDNIYLFGTLTPAVEDIRYDQRFHGVKPDPQMAAVLDHIRHGVYGPGMIFEPLLSRGYACPACARARFLKG